MERGYAKELIELDGEVKNDHSGNGNLSRRSQRSGPFCTVHSKLLTVKVISLPTPKVGSFICVDVFSDISTIFICGNQFSDL